MSLRTCGCVRRMVGTRISKIAVHSRYLKYGIFVMYVSKWPALMYVTVCPARDELGEAGRIIHVGPVGTGMWPTHTQAELFWAAPHGY